MTHKKSPLPVQALSARQSQIIETMLDSYSATDSAVVARHYALPLYRGWTQTIAIRPDGLMLMWDDAGEVTYEPVETVFIRAALMRVSAMHNELKTLIPKRPDDTIVCDMCCGSGVIQEPKLAALRILCQCGGVGWIDAVV